MTKREAVRVLRRAWQARCDNHTLNRETDAVLTVLRALERPTRLERDAARLLLDAKFLDRSRELLDLSPTLSLAHICRWDKSDDWEMDRAAFVRKVREKAER